jgi:hypothetical protein
MRLHYQQANVATMEEELIDELEFTETMELSIKVSGALMGVEPESATEGETSLKA